MQLVSGSIVWQCHCQAAGTARATCEQEGVLASKFHWLCHLLFFVNSDLRSFQQLHLLQCFQLAMLPGQGGSTSAPAFG